MMLLRFVVCVFWRLLFVPRRGARAQRRRVSGSCGSSCRLETKWPGSNWTSTATTEVVLAEPGASLEARVVGCERGCGPAFAFFVEGAARPAVTRSSANGRTVRWRVHDPGEYTLTVRHWADAAYFAAPCGGDNLRTNPVLGGHVVGSPAFSVRFVTEQSTTTKEQCRGAEEGRWVRWLDSSKSSVRGGVFDPRRTMRQRVPDDATVRATCSHWTTNRCPLGSGARASKGGVTAEVPFGYVWRPYDCSLRDWVSTALLVDEIAESRNRATKTVELSFLGDSVTNYLCRTLATALSNHTLTTAFGKFTDEANIAGQNRLKANVHKFRGTKCRSLVLNCLVGTNRGTICNNVNPGGQAKFASKLALRAKPNGTERIFVVGDSTAHYVCSAKSKAVEETRRLVRLGSTREDLVVWLAPSRPAKSFLAKTSLLRQQLQAVWEEEVGALQKVVPKKKKRIVDMWGITEAVPELAEDGLHYNVAIYRGGTCGKHDSDSARLDSGATCRCNNCTPAAGPNARSGARYDFAGPAAFAILRALANSILS